LIRWVFLHFEEESSICIKSLVSLEGSQEIAVNDSTQDQLVADVARDLVGQVAPQEMPLFRANSEAYFKDPEKALKDRKSEEEMLGFGTGEAMSFVTPVALAVSVEVVKFVADEVKQTLKTESSGMINDLIKSLFKKYRPTLEKEQRPTAAPLTAEQLQEVHKAAFAKARQLKLSEARAKQLADVLIGDLVSPN
jgi:hypothetical protein